MVGDNQANIHDIAVSFAGEDREYVELLVNELKSRGISVFYDADFETELWGKNLVNHFGEVYRDRACFFVPFVSANYIKKNWTRIELQNAQDRAFNHPDENYILPIKLDDTELPGFPSTFGYISWKSKSVETIATMLCQKLGKKEALPEHAQNSQFPQIEMPAKKVTFTDLDYRKACRESFRKISEYFKVGLAQISTKRPEIQGDFDEITSGKFIASLFRDGELKNEIKVFIGGLGRTDRVISFSIGRNLSRDEDNSYSGVIKIEESDGELTMKYDAFSSLSMIGSPEGQSDDPCAQLWRDLISPLAHS